MRIGTTSPHSRHARRRLASDTNARAGFNWFPTSQAGRVQGTAAEDRTVAIQWRSEERVVTFDAGQTLKVTARTLLLTVVAFPCIAFSQVALESAEDRERRIIERIDQEQSQNGPYSEALIGPLTALGLLHEERGDHESADAITQRVLQVIRANYGLYSLEQAPSIRRLIARAEARGNVAAAWDLEQELLMLAGRHHGDIRTAAIFRETADKRMDILRRYDSGEFPAEIVLGCYYSKIDANFEAHLRGSQPMFTSPGPKIHNNCAAGSKRQARRSLLTEAQSYYAQTIDVLLENEHSSNALLKELLTGLIEDSHRYNTPGTGRRSLQYLVAHEATNSDDWLSQAEALVQLADWDLMYSRDFGTKYTESALTTYQQAYDLLKEHKIARESIDAIFSPETPVLLPSFARSPFEPRETTESSAHIDVAFVITKDGKGEGIEILDTTQNTSRAAERDVVQLMKHSRFRPRVTNDQFADSEPIIVRFHLDD